MEAPLQHKPKKLTAVGQKRTGKLNNPVRLPCSVLSEAAVRRKRIWSAEFTEARLRRSDVGAGILSEAAACPVA